MKKLRRKNREKSYNRGAVLCKKCKVPMKKRHLHNDYYGLPVYDYICPECDTFKECK